LDLTKIIHPQLSDFVLPTEVRRLAWLEKYIGYPVYLKLESNQKTGSFKYRGAMNRLLFTDKADVVGAGSAGNHGLAIGCAAAELGRKSNIFVPISASQLKKERILQTGSGMVEIGGSVEDASLEAQTQCAKNNWKYISPYNDKHVIAGQSTVWSEFFHAYPEIRHIVSPIGGGGLASGAISARNEIDGDIEIFGCEPKMYASMSESLENGQITEVLRRPTFADGLATNIESKSITFDIINAGINEIVTLDEEDIATGIQLLLKKESLLIEGAGAISILACINLARRGKIRGPVGLVACGGNISMSSLSRILGFRIEKPSNLELLERFGTKVNNVISSRLISNVKDSSEILNTGSLSDANSTLLETVGGVASRAQLRLQKFVDFCDKSEMSLPNSWVEHTKQFCQNVEDSIQAIKDEIITDTETSALFREIQIRTAIQETAVISNLNAWRSASYHQSEIPQFFDLNSQDSGDVNYERYGHEEVRRIERQLSECIGLDQETTSCIVTASGMAAYNVIEAFILREVLSSSDVVVASPGIYFEVEEQISTLPDITYQKLNVYSSNEIYDQIVKLNPKVVFLDPLTNTIDQRLLDIPDIIIKISRLENHPFIVIDGTMLPGVIREYLKVCAKLNNKILYFESASKYLQLGLDISMAGLVVCHKSLEATMHRLRRNTGTILNEMGSYCFPSYSSSTLKSRIIRMERNACCFSKLIFENKEINSLLQVVHPSLSVHSDKKIYEEYRRGGACVTFRLLSGSDHKEQLEVLIDMIIGVSKSHKFPMIKGVSFGFSSPRISAASAMAENEPPFLRLSIGDLEEAKYTELADIFVTACRHFKQIGNVKNEH
jgi:threonine dehydratase/cystathionine beta-lyase/cystathionine gamma-synthase